MRQGNIAGECWIRGLVTLTGKCWRDRRRESRRLMTLTVEGMGDRGTDNRGLVTLTGEC